MYGGFILVALIMGLIQIALHGKSSIDPLTLCGNNGVV